MNAGVIENCGKYSRIAPAGCICMQWPFESIVRTLSLKILQLNVICDTKTKDNVFVKAVVSGTYSFIVFPFESRPSFSRSFFIMISALQGH